MPGIAQDTVERFAERVAGFAAHYVEDWNGWLDTAESERPNRFGQILRKWQACRPNRMRRIEQEAEHDAPYIETLIEEATPFTRGFAKFDLRDEPTLTPEVCDALAGFWKVFERLSYRGPARNGLSGVVGISKAALLLSDGRIGPAFDSQVRRNLAIGEIRNAEDWIQAIRFCQCDVRQFEQNTNAALQTAVPVYAHLATARIYDMALGPAGGLTRCCR